MTQGAEDPTVIDGPGRPAAMGDLEPTPVLPSDASNASNSHTAGSPSAWRHSPGAFDSEGVARARALTLLAALVCGAALIAIWVPSGSPPGRSLATVTLVAVSIISTGLALWYRDEKRFDQRLELGHGVVCVLVILSMCVYLGVYSPAVMTLCLGIYYFGLSDWDFASWLIYGFSALGYFALCLMAAFGVLDVTKSLLSMQSIDAATLVAFGLLVQVILGLTFWLARQSRAATVAAFQRLERAAKQIHKRDALIDEAQADLDRAMRTRQGAYSGLLVEEFQVVEVVGRGAMGEVYRGYRVNGGEPVALKFLLHVAAEDPNHISRFFREAEIVSGLDSPHIVRVIRTGHAPDGAPFIAMELLEGEDLAQKLRRKRRLGIAATLELVEQVARALAVADAAGVVHRDLKPQNLFQVERGSDRCWKILDFGVSKVMASTGTLTQGAAVGTPSYMSPEQAKGINVDHRADVFALGVIAYRCLTGRPAFTGPDMVSTIYNVLHVQPVRPLDLVRVPADVERVLALALAKKQERRFSSASMLAAALQEAVKHRLDERLRADADALLREHPWGTDDEDLPRPADRRSLSGERASTNVNNR